MARLNKLKFGQYKSKYSVLGLAPFFYSDSFLKTLLELTLTNDRLKTLALEPTLWNDQLKITGLEPTLLTDRLKIMGLERTLSNDWL
jgi:hypothetical protein